MEAKDTVMDDKELVQAITDNPNVPMGQALIEKQAEISFKAGEESERKKHDLSYCEQHKLYYCDCCPDCFLAIGRKEVVEWVNHERENQNPSVWYSRWQAKQKEWGL